MFYFFNPFRQEVMSRVMENIRASHEDQPRDMIVVYYNPNPVIVSLLERVGFLRKVSTKPLPRDLASPYRRGLVIYESRP